MEERPSWVIPRPHPRRDRSFTEMLGRTPCCSGPESAFDEASRPRSTRTNFDRQIPTDETLALHSARAVSR
jgi:hypothetical protein